MNITVVCDVLGKENNGTTTAAMNLIRSMKAKGHHVRVVCPDPERKGEKDFFVVPQYNLLFLKKYLQKNGVSLAKPVKKTLEEAIEGADVVHMLIPFMLSRSALKICRAKGIPVTAGFHCQAENFTSHIFLKDSRLAAKLVYHNFYNRFYRYVDAVHYPTRFICDIFENETAPTNHYVISNGVHKRFKPLENKNCEKKPDEPFTIVFTGRYSKEKSHKVLIDGVAQSKYSDRIRLVFAGSGPLEEKLKKYAAKKLVNQPEFRFFSRDKLIEELHNADLYVHPAEIEIEAIACLEAICSGLVPVIADSPRSATRYFALDEKNLFRFNDPADLAAKIDWWLEHPEERRKRSDEYSEMRGQFDFDNCMDQMERMLYETAAKKRRTGSRGNGYAADEFAEAGLSEGYFPGEELTAEVAANG
ncbi:MAG: glycosyltransferase [Clostridia bacterium]|nr:glycosyltransferase [Clostridia bacterium]